MQSGGLRTKGITKTSTPEKTLITVVTVVYNGATTLEQTIQSVVNQTYDNVEYIIIDGASTDASLDIIKKYEDKIDYWQSEPDKGIYDAMNKGIAMAKGKIIGIVNSDDYYEPNTLEVVKNAFISNKPYQILYGMIRNIDEEGEIDSIRFSSHKRMEKEMIPHPTCFVTSKLYQDKGTYSLQYKSSSDYDFLLKMYRDTDVEFIPIYSILSNFTLGGESSKLASHIETFKIWRKYGCISTRRYWMITLSTYAKAIIK